MKAKEEAAGRVIEMVVAMTKEGDKTAALAGRYILCLTGEFGMGIVPAVELALDLLTAELGSEEQKAAGASTWLAEVGEAEATAANLYAV